MINRFPKRLWKKWNRFNKLEKLFIIYSIILLLLSLFIPVLKITDLTTNHIKETFSLFNSNFVILDIFLIFTLIFMILRNSSFRFRKLIYILVWFKENEWLVNLGILIVLTMILITIWQLTKFVQIKISGILSLHRWYYVLAWYLIIWYILNLFLSLNFSIKKRKWNLINIIPNTTSQQQNSESKIKEEVLFKV